MQITKISVTKRGRYALFIDDEFLFSVDEETLAKSGISEGSPISEGELSLLRENSETRKAKDSALRYLSLRAYAETELYRKLCLKFDEYTSAAAVAAMRDLELLNDEVFAYEKAKGMAQRGKSPFEILQKLASLGVDGEIAQNAVEAQEIDGAETALALVRKSYMHKLENGEAEKVKAALARKGFSYADIKNAVEAAMNEIETGEEWEN